MTFELTPAAAPATSDGGLPRRFVQFQLNGVDVGDPRVVQTVNFTGDVRATLNYLRGKLTLEMRDFHYTAPGVGALALAGLAPTVSIPNHIILLLHGEGANAGTTVFDSSPYNHNPPANNLATTTSTTQFKYGAASLLFSAAAGSYLEYSPTSEWLFGSGDFTLAAWVRPSTVDATRRSLFDFRFDGSGSGTSWAVDFINTAIRFEVGIGSSLFTVTAGTLTVDTWQYVAFVRDGGTLRSYVNGVQVGSTSGLGTSAINGAVSTAKIRVGRRNDGSQNYDGWMDEVYINDICLYPNGTTFTPPAGPFSP